MSSTRNPGRFAGLLYVLMSIVGFFALMYVPIKVFTFTQPAVFGELAFMFWLLIKGAKPPALPAAAY